MGIHRVFGGYLYLLLPGKNRQNLHFCDVVWEDNYKNENSAFGG